MNTKIISDKCGNGKKISNVRDGIHLANINYIKKIVDKPNNVNSIISVPNTKSKISKSSYK